MAKCRACLATEVNLITVDWSFIQNFNLLTGLNFQITMTEKTYTCKTCYDAVNYFMDFREKCIESDIIFRENIRDEQEAKHESEPSLDKNEYDLSYLKQEMKDNSFVTAETLNDDDDYLNISKNTNKKNKTVSNKRKISQSNTKVMKENMNKRKLSKEMKRKKEKHADNKVNCGLCDTDFDSRHDLSKHLEYHKSLFSTQLSCGLCTERFQNLPHMLGHRLEHLPGDQRVCHICSKKFIASSATCLEFHYMRVHGMAEKDAQIQCKQCASSYADSRKLIRHVRNCHSEPRYECRLCKKSFRNKTLLNIHNRIQHTQGEIIKCEQCDFTSKYTNSLMLHTRRKHTSNTFLCKACRRVFIDEVSLNRHVNGVCKHHTKVVCSVCGHTVRKVWLKHHMRSHSDEYPFKCDKCPAHYKYRTGLKDHSDKHKGVLSFHCDICTKSFCIKSALRSHRRNHTEEKPYVCIICKVGFKRRYNLIAHMNAHPLSALNENADKKL